MVTERRLTGDGERESMQSVLREWEGQKELVREREGSQTASSMILLTKHASSDANTYHICRSESNDTLRLNTH